MIPFPALGLSALLLCAAPAAAQDALPAHPDDIPVPPLEPYVPPQPSRTELPGGATLLLIENDELPLVDGRLLLRCGTIQDPAGKAGLARLVADVLREGGSESESGAQLDAWLDAHAATLTVRATDDRISIEFACLAEDTGEVLQRIADLLVAPAYPAEQLEKGRARLLTEIERRDDDTGALADRVLLQVIYGPSSPWSRVETPESVASITREDLLRYHRAHFGVDRLLVGVTGDTSSSRIETSFVEHFAELPEVGPAPEVPAPSFVQPQRTSVYVYDRPGVPQSELRIAAPGTRRMHSSYSALNLWSYVVGIGGMTNRMMVRVRTELGLAYSVGAYFRPEWERSGRLEAFCSTRNDGVADAAIAMIDVLRSGLEEIPPAELEETRSRALNAEVFRVDTADEVLDRALDLEFHGYPADFYQQHFVELRELTGEDVITAARRQLDPGRLVVLAVGPYDEIADSLARIGEVERVELGAGDSGGTALVDAGPLLERMFGAIGGRERWANARWLDYESVVQLPQGEIRVRIRRDLDAPRMRFSNSGGDTAPEQTFVVNADGAWIMTQDQVAPVPDLHQQLLAALHHDPFALLHGIANGLSVGADSSGALIVREGPAAGTRIELDVAGRPTRLVAAQSPEPLSYTMQGWTEGDALDAPARITKEQSDQTREIVRLATPETLDEALFEPPTGD